MSLLTASLKRGGVAAVVISHMPMYQGVINPAEEVYRFLSLQKRRLVIMYYIYPSLPIGSLFHVVVIELDRGISTCRIYTCTDDDSGVSL